MKRAIQFFLLLLLIAGMESCGTKPAGQAKRTILYFLPDCTEATGDRKSMVPTQWCTDRIVADGGYGSVYLKQINAASLSKEMTVTIRAREDGEEDYSYQDETDDFATKLDSAFSIYLAKTSGSSNSCIYRAVCQSANDMAAMKADKKIMVLMSDGVENSLDGNFYKLPQEPTDAEINAIVTKLEATGITLPDNSGIEMIILFDPQNDLKRSNDFNKSMKIWHKLFEKHGIQYTEKANLTI